MQAAAASLAGAARKRPNILWISCEDTSPQIGCYGDPHAITPNIDGSPRKAYGILAPML